MFRDERKVVGMDPFSSLPSRLRKRKVMAGEFVRKREFGSEPLRPHPLSDTRAMILGKLGSVAPMPRFVLLKVSVLTEEVIEVMASQLTVALLPFGVTIDEDTRAKEEGVESIARAIR